jgi:uncharacterized SAM-binding protein YcdF (DUF218 family)
VNTAFRALWWAVDPQTWLPALGLAALVMLTWKRTRATVALGAATLGLWVLLCVVPLGPAVFCALEEAFPVAYPNGPVSAVVVLGGSEEAELTAAHGRPAFNGAGERVMAGVELARLHPEASLVLTGGRPVPWREGPAEAVVARQQVVALGVPAERVRVDVDAANTQENARNVKALLGPLQGAVVLVSSAFHLPRAVLLFEGQGQRVSPFPVDHRCLPGMAWDWAPSRNLGLLSVALHEWAGLLVYRLRGDTHALWPGGTE